jgi:hypothetical protein
MERIKALKSKKEGGSAGAPAPTTSAAKLPVTVVTPAPMGVGGSVRGQVSEVRLDGEVDGQGMMDMGTGEVAVGPAPGPAPAGWTHGAGGMPLPPSEIPSIAGAMQRAVSTQRAPGVVPAPRTSRSATSLMMKNTDGDEDYCE